MVDYLPISDDRLREIQSATEQDEALQVLKTVILEGWSENRSDVPLLAVPYFNDRDELTVQNGIIFKGSRCVIPKSLRPNILSRIHSSHLGIESCLRRARECVYWPLMNSEVKDFISKCTICRTYETAQCKETLMSHDVPQRPWEKVGADLFTLEQKDYLVTTDYYSNFIEIDRLYDTSSSTVINKLKAHFARYGIPDCVVSDNGPQFNSDAFTKFANTWDFEHCPSSPGHSQSNGKAESSVKTAKKLIKKAKKSQYDPYLALLDHRNTPSQVTSTSPAQKLMNRRTKTLLPTAGKLLLPKTIDIKREREKMKQSQDKQAKNYNKNAKDLPPLQQGDTVRIKPFVKNNKEWQQGTVSRRLDERSYEVITPTSTLRRNRVYLRKTNETATNSDEPANTQNIMPCINLPEAPSTSDNVEPQNAVANSNDNNKPSASESDNTNDNSAKDTTAPVTTRSGRRVKQPAKYNNFVK